MVFSFVIPENSLKVDNCTDIAVLVQNVLMQSPENYIQREVTGFESKAYQAVYHGCTRQQH